MSGTAVVEYLPKDVIGFWMVGVPLGSIGGLVYAKVEA